MPCMLVLMVYSAMSYRMPGMVETSTNLAAVKFIENDTILITTSQRSDVDSEKMNIAHMVAAVFRLIGAEVEHGEGYPGWAPNPESAILKIAVESYKQLFGYEPVVRSIHARIGMWDCFWRNIPEWIDFLRPVLTWCAFPRMRK